MKPCCTTNRQIVEQHSDRIVRRCTVCQTKHIEVTLQPGRIGLKLR